MEGAAAIVSAPESRIALLGFLVSFVWEMWQLPYYQTHNMELSQMVGNCTLASVADAGIMVFAYLVAGWRSGQRHWLASPTVKHFAFYLATGLIVTIIIEHIATAVPFGWRYGENMAVIPGIETGLVPVLMWIVVPLVTFGIARWGVRDV